MAERHEPLPFLPYGRQNLDEDDFAAVRRVLESDWLTTGPEIDAFEAVLCQATGAKFAIACSSGTAALHIAARSLDLGPGDHVIVPSMTFAATANVMRLQGAEVIFADVDPATGLMDAGHAAAALAATDNDVDVKAVFPVHFAGQVADPAGMAAFASEHGLQIVADACHALGGAYQDQVGGWHRVGGNDHDTMSCFSFHPVKAAAMGEGGAVTTNDPVLASALSRHRNHGIVRGDMMTAADPADPWQYEVVEVGHNYRTSDIHAALGRSQLSKLDSFIDKRRQLVAHYEKLLAPLAPAVLPLARAKHCQPAWHLFVALVDWSAIGLSRRQVMARLQNHGIGTQVHYIPLHQQPYYRRRYGDQPLPGVEKYYQSCLSLPLYPSLENRDVERVVETLRDIIAG
jgi:UDP-4-amino-4,6-dideoxy-N-acetyl-beta-L-altrosamine transaminase